ncbi:MAG: tail fiber domain-containing protein [Flavitalea sp.]
MKNIIIGLVAFMSGNGIMAQVGIGTTTPNSMLDVRGSLALKYSSVTGSVTLGSADQTVVFTGSSASTITLPSAASIIGRTYQLKNSSATIPVPIVTIATTSSQTIDGISSWILDEANESVTLISNGTNWSITGQSLPTGSGTNWSQGGNSVAAIKNFGTLNNNHLPFITNNTERMRLSNTGNLALGTTTFDGTNPEKLLVDAGASATSYNVISGKGTINNYLQLNIQNRSSGTSASSDLVATADNGSETVNFVDLGINSSAYSASGFTITSINDAYLYSTGNDFAIGNSSSGKSVKFFTNGTMAANERMRIDGSGNVGIGVTSPAYRLQVSATSNPLSLGGVQSGASTDSVLTILNGVVRRLHPSASNNWMLTGNASTNPSTNFLGTTDAQALVFKVSAAQVQRFELNSIAIGLGATTNNSLQSYAFGSGATVGYNKLASMAIGNNSAINSDSAFAIGVTATANALSSFAIGTGATASSANSFAIGRNATVSYSVPDAVAIGVNASSTAISGISIGSTSTAANKTIANGVSAIAIGTTAKANSANAIALGTNATVGYSLTNPGMALGAAAIANGNNAVALGNSSSVGFAANSSALGASSSVSAANSTAIGYNTAVTKANAIILGDLSNGSLSVGIGSENFNGSNREKLLVDAGTAATSYNVISGKGTIDNYLQLNIQNRSNGVSASSDLVATADNGSETANFVNLGINSSGYTTSGILGGVNNAYLYTTGNDFILGNNTNNKSLIFYTTASSVNTERMRISTLGVFPGQDIAYALGSTSKRWTEVWSANGTIQTSDIRLKKNIHPLALGLKEVMAMQPVSYDWKDNSGKDKIGLIAQEVRKLVPQVVSGNEEKENLGMNYAELVPVLINAIKEQQLQVSAQQLQINLLQKELEALKAK